MRFSKALCYPSLDPECLQEKRKKLVNCGVTEIFNEGNLAVKNWLVLGRGHSAIVLKAKLKNGELLPLKFYALTLKEMIYPLNAHFLLRDIQLLLKLTAAIRI